MRTMESREPWQCEKSPTGAHYWLLESPDPDKITIEGKCRYCPEKRRFDEEKYSWLYPRKYDFEQVK